MRFELDRHKGRITDNETGIIVALRGRPEPGEMSFAFCDPGSDAISSRGDNWFYFAAKPIYADDPRPYKLKEQGYQLSKGELWSSLLPYHRENNERFEAAKRYIIAALSKYLQETADTAQPTIDLV